MKIHTIFNVFLLELAVESLIGGQAIFPPTPVIFDREGSIRSKKYSTFELINFVSYTSSGGPPTNILTRSMPERSTNYMQLIFFMHFIQKF